MKRIGTRTLTGRALDWVVTGIELRRLEAEGEPMKLWVKDSHAAGHYIDTYTDMPLFAHPIIVRENISVQKKHDGWWLAGIYNLNDDLEFIQLSHEHLEAAMRTYVHKVLGEAVEVPDALA